ncbi:MAG: tetratricopeptide repeat protein, partial [Tepidisphaeraceae bacterium]
AEAEPLYRESLAIREKLLGKDHPSYLSSLNNLSRVVRVQGKLSEAESMLRDVLRESRRVLKDDHPSTTLAMNELAALLAEDLKQYSEAASLHREALERRRRTMAEDDIDTLQSTQNLGRLLTLVGKYAEAEPLLRRAIEGRQKVLGENHRHTLSSMNSLSLVYEAQGQFAEAEPLLARLCTPAGLAVWPAGSHPVFFQRWGCCLTRLGRYTDAEAPLLRAHEMLRAANRDKTEFMRQVLEALVEVLDHTNRPEEASHCRSELAKISTATAPTTSP